MSLKNNPTKRRLERPFERPGKKSKTIAFAGVATPFTKGGNPVQSELPAASQAPEVLSKTTKANTNSPQERGSSVITNDHEDVEEEANLPHARGESAMIDSLVTDSKDAPAMSDVEGRLEDGVKAEGRAGKKRKVKVRVRGVGVGVDVVVDGIEDVKVDVRVGRCRTRGEGRERLKLEDIDVKPKLE